MHAGSLDRVVVIQSSTEAIDANGVPVFTWSDTVTLRAARLDNAATETKREHGASTERRVTFLTRFVAGLTLANRLIFEGVAFNIVSLEEVGRRRGLEITAERIGP